MSYYRNFALKLSKHKAFILLESGKKETGASGEGNLGRRITLETYLFYYNRHFRNPNSTHMQQFGISTILTSNFKHVFFISARSIYITVLFSPYCFMYGATTCI